MKISCKNCINLDLSKRTQLEGRLRGKFRYGCSYRESGCINGVLATDENLEMFGCEGWQDRSGRKTSAGLQQKYDDELQELFDRWMTWYTYGSPDISAPDGTCLNRIRDSIIRLLRKIEEDLEPEDYPECYYSKLPEKLAEQYMVNSGEIRKMAVRALMQYENHEEYQWLCENMPKLDSSMKEQSEAYRLLNHADSLRQAIYDEDFFRMKRESRQEHLYREMANLREQIRKKAGKPKRRRKGSSNRPLVGQLGVPDLAIS